MSFHSQHKLSTKLAIFKGEAVRHMVNCSDPEDFHREIATLRQTLLQRGYPHSALPEVAYDQCRRQKLLRRLHCRSKDGERHVNQKDVVVFKCPYSRSVNNMGIPRTEFKRLKRELQKMRGCATFSVTQGAWWRTQRRRIAHHRERHGLNFVPDDRRRDTALRPERRSRTQAKIARVGG